MPLGLHVWPELMPKILIRHVDGTPSPEMAWLQVVPLTGNATYTVRGYAYCGAASDKHL